MAQISPILPEKDQLNWDDEMLDALHQLIQQGNGLDLIISSGRLADPELKKVFASLNSSGQLVIDGVVIQTGGGSSTPGPAGEITGATVSLLAPGATPTITLGGTPSARTFAFALPAAQPGIDGLDGADAFVDYNVMGIDPKIYWDGTKWETTIALKKAAIEAAMGTTYTKGRWIFDSTDFLTGVTPPSDPGLATTGIKARWRRRAVTA